MKLSVTSAAALLLASLFASPVAYAYCDEDCAYERQEAAYERAYERASGSEDDEGYGRQSRGGYSQPSGRSARRAPQPEPPAETKSSSQSSSKSRKTAREDEPSGSKPTVTTRSQRLRDGDVANENSSIVGGSSQVAEDDTQEPRPAKRAVGCKTYFPSVGMTLSVRCD